MAGWLSRMIGKKPGAVDVERVAPVVDEENKKNARSLRQNSFMEVVVVTEYGYKRQGVAIDVSDTGARIRFHTAESMPPRIRLRIPKMKIDCAAEVVWHKGVDVGVRFG